MKNNKSIITIAVIILGMVGLLYGLTKIATRTNTPPIEVTTPVAAGEHIFGPQNAPVTLIEYSDFQCPACRAYQPTLKRLLAEYDQELRLVYRHFPLNSLHANAEEAAYAAEAAGIQGKFFEYHDVLFNTQDKWEGEKNPESMFVEYAKSLGLNEEQFRRDIKSDIVKDKVAADVRSANESNLSGTPSFFLNGKLFEPPKTYEGFSAAVVEQLILTGNNEVGNSTSTQ